MAPAILFSPSSSPPANAPAAGLRPTGYGPSGAYSPLHVFSNRNFVNLIKLDISNWHSWKYQLIAQATQIDADLLLEEGITEYNEYLSSTLALNDAMSLTDFTALDKSIGIFITSTLQENAINHIRHLPVRHGLQIYQALASHYESRSTSSTKQVIRDLIQMKQGDESVAGLIDKVRRKRNTLNRIQTARKEFNLTDELATMALLDGLKPEYSTIKDLIALSQSDDTPIEFERCVQIVNSKAEQIESQRARASASARSVSTAPASHPQIQAPVICTYCGKNGHTEDVCFKKKREDKKPKAKTTSSTPASDKPDSATTASSDSTDTPPVTHVAWTAKTTACATRRSYAQVVATPRPFHKALSARTAFTGPPAEIIHFDIDSGATDHFVASPEGLSDFKPDQTITIETANQEKVTSRGCGSIPGKIDPVHVVPSFGTNLLSVYQLCRTGHKVTFLPDGTVPITLNGKPVCQGALEGNTYRLHLTNLHASGAKSSKLDQSALIQLWHRRLGHSSAASIHRLSSTGHLLGLEHTTLSALEDVCGHCEPCLVGKSKAQPHRDLGGKLTATTPFELIHFDTKGPFETNSYGGNRFALIIVDDFSRAKYVYPLKAKSQALDALKEFLGVVVKPTGRHIRRCHSDNAGEYQSSQFVKWCIQEGIKPSYTSPHSSASNGIAERAIQQIDTTARAIRIAGNLPKACWAECYRTAALIDRLTLPSNGRPSPHVLIHGTDPEFKLLRAIGCKCYVHKHGVDRQTLDSRAISGILVGYSEFSKCYRVLTNLQRGDIVESTNIKFVESADSSSNVTDDGFIDPTTLPQPPPTNPIVPVTTQPVTAPFTRRQTRGGTCTLPSHPDWGRVSTGNVIVPVAASQTPDANLIVDVNTTEKEISDLMNPSPPLMHPNTKTADHNLTCVANAAKRVTFNEAKSDPRLVESMKKEIDQINAVNGWVIEDLPPGRKKIGCTWVHKLKTVNGVFERAKSRICPQGFAQVPGLDYHVNEIAAPTIALPSVRMYFSIVCCRRMYERQLDVDAAFTLPELKETVYMDFPQGVERIPGKALRLLHSLNGLKQGAFNWFKMITKFLKTINLKPCISEPCLFTRRDNGSLLMIALYTDDLRVAADNEAQLDAFETALGKAFPIKRANHIQFLGIQVDRSASDGSLLLHQRPYIESVIETFGFQDLKPATTPVIPNSKLFPVEGEKDTAFMSTFPYMRLVGALLWIARCTRDDILYSVSQIGRFSHNFNQIHADAVVRILAYLKGTSTVGLTFTPAESIVLRAYSDSDHAGEPQEGTHPMRSTTGTTVLVIGCGTVYSQSTLQDTIATSSSAAEYIALGNTVQKTMCMKMLLCELDLFQPDKPITVYEDNEVTITKVKSPVVDFKLRHLKVHHHAVREYISQRDIEVTHVRTDRNIADIFTKALPRPQFLILRGLLLNEPGCN